MRVGLPGRRFALTVGMVVGLGCLPAGGRAQNRPGPLEGPHFGIGYIANAPELMGGIGGYFIVPKFGGIGLYMDAKIDLKNPSDTEEFEADWTPERVADEVTGANYLEHESSYSSVNLAVIRPLNPFLMVYGGGGLVRRTRYMEYEDPNRTLGRGGVFWVESPTEEETRVNLMLGMMMRVSSRITSHFGFETQPRGITAGLTLRFPSW